MEMQIHGRVAVFNLPPRQLARHRPPFERRQAKPRWMRGRLAAFWGVAMGIKMTDPLLVIKRNYTISADKPKAWSMT